MINYVIGDATKPQVENGVRVIAHICNNECKWGSGFVLALSAKWPQPEKNYREWGESWTCWEEGLKMPLGIIKLVAIPRASMAGEDGSGPLYVANMVAQDGFVHTDNPVAVRYDALIKCFVELDKWINNYQEVKRIMSIDSHIPLVTIHMPRLGTGLAGGTWAQVEPIINGTLSEHDVYVYDLPEEQT